jgi:hypothetical protein
VLAKEIDLSDDAITSKGILNYAASVAQEKCPSPAGIADILIFVHHGDPTTFTDDKFTGLERFGRTVNLEHDGKPYGETIYNLFNKEYPVLAIAAQTQRAGVTAITEAVWSQEKGATQEKAVYHNYDKERSDQIERKKTEEALLAKQQAQQAEVARVQREQQAEAARVQEARRNAQIAAEHATAQKQQADIQSRSAAFIAANGVKHFVTIKQLAANPFVYQGEVVAVYAVFAQMNSATEGLFGGNDLDALLVSAIPPGKFTQANSMVMLAGRVVGKQEVKLPLVGSTMVPHLSFVGSAFCREQGCSEYHINLK